MSDMETIPAVSNTIPWILGPASIFHLCCISGSNPGHSGTSMTILPSLGSLPHFQEFRLFSAHKSHIVSCSIHLPQCPECHLQYPLLHGYLKFDKTPLTPNGIAAPTTKCPFVLFIDFPHLPRDYSGLLLLSMRIRVKLPRFSGLEN